MLEKGSVPFKYKFPQNETESTLDSAIRQNFKLPSNVTYSLVDVKDGATIAKSTLHYMDNNTEILVKIDDLNWKKSSELIGSSNQQRGIFSFCSFPFI